MYDIDNIIKKFNDNHIPISVFLLGNKWHNNIENFAYDKTLFDISALPSYYKNKIQKGDKVLVIIGPEGGFSQREFAFFKERRLPLITLGDLILKADTAVIIALGDIIYEYQG